MDYAWSHAIISDETHDIIGKSCDFSSNDTWSNEDCNKAIEELLRQYKEIDMYSLYTSVCPGDSASYGDKFSQVMFLKNSKMVSGNTFLCFFFLAIFLSSELHSYSFFLSFFLFLP